MEEPERASAPRLRRRDLGWFLIAASLPVPWVAAYQLGGLGIPPEGVAMLAGLAILGAAFMLSWSMELAERDIPQNLALLVLALVSVLPEYAVDLHFAITAAEKPEYAHYAIANMTGANRLLIGLGWAAVVLIACQKDRVSSIRIEPHHRIEMRALLLATVYAFVIPLNGYVGLVDAAVLLGIFVLYVRAAMRGETHEAELLGPALILSSEFGDVGRRVWAAVMFVFAGWAIWVSAEPFADSLIHVGSNYDIDEFLLVQWVAPLASESPEFAIAILFALRGRGSVGLGALISSKVNQWTLLVGALPIAFVAAGGGWHGLPLDGRQTEELVLTSAQSLLATLLIAEFAFSRAEAVLLAALFVVQLVFTDPSVRLAFCGLYLVIFALAIALAPARREAFLDLMRIHPRGPGAG
jgi:cation:H+ antiporter